MLKSPDAVFAILIDEDNNVDPQLFVIGSNLPMKLVDELLLMYYEYYAMFWQQDDTPTDQTPLPFDMWLMGVCGVKATLVESTYVYYSDQI